jgi:hypothetical protein
VPEVYPVKVRPNQSELQKKIAEMRKPGPVRKLLRTEIEAMEHKRNLERYLKRPR